MQSLLKIRDENGNFIPIDAIKGDNGKSAYEQAKEGGYTGTEAEFIQLLGSLSGINALQLAELDEETEEQLAAHIINSNNPHRVTAAQVGLGNVDNTSDANKPISTAVQAALSVLTNNLSSHTSASNPHGITAGGIGAIPTAYTVSTDLNTQLQAGGTKMTVCSYNSSTKNTPKTQGITSYAHGMVITNAYTDQYGVQLCMPSGDSNMYIRKKDGSGISDWVKVCNAGDIPTMPKVSQTLTYTGTGTTGQDNPCTLTFEAQPKMVVISDHMASYIGFFIRGVNQFIVFSSNGIMSSGANVTWSGNKLTWYMANGGQYYQLNGGTWKYSAVGIF